MSFFPPLEHWNCRRVSPHTMFISCIIFYHVSVHLEWWTSWASCFFFLLFKDLSWSHDRKRGAFSKEILRGPVCTKKARTWESSWLRSSPLPHFILVVRPSSLVRASIFEVLLSFLNVRQSLSSAAVDPNISCLSSSFFLRETYRFEDGIGCGEVKGAAYPEVSRYSTKIFWESVREVVLQC